MSKKKLFISFSPLMTFKAYSPHVVLIILFFFFGLQKKNRFFLLLRNK